MFAQDPEILIGKLQKRIHELCPPLMPGHFNAPQPPHDVIAAMPELAREALWATNELRFLNDLLFHISKGQEGNRSTQPRPLPEGDSRGITEEDKAFTPGETTFEIRPGWESEASKNQQVGRSQTPSAVLFTAARYAVRKFGEWCDAGGKPNPGLCLAMDGLERSISAPNPSVAKEALADPVHAYIMDASPEDVKEMMEGAGLDPKTEAAWVEDIIKKNLTKVQSRTEAEKMVDAHAKAVIEYNSGKFRFGDLQEARESLVGVITNCIATNCTAKGPTDGK